MYYNSRTIECHKTLLEEYFYNIDIVDVAEYKDNKFIKYKVDLKESKEQALEILAQHKEILVGYKDIALENRLSYELTCYHMSNNLWLDKIDTTYKQLRLVDLIKDNKLTKLIDTFTEYVLEYGFSVDLAWELSNVGNRKRGSVLGIINNIAYKMLYDDAPHLINNDIISNKVYDYIVRNLQIGMSYTNEHLKMMCDRLKDAYNIEISTTKLGSTINEIYVIDSKQVKMCKGLETVFVYNSNPNWLHDGKRFSLNTVNRFYTTQDVNEQFGLHDDTSIEDYVQARYRCNTRENIVMNRI